jgi:hypothetical protein
VPRSRPPYPPEFRAEAVRRARSAQQPLARTARGLGVSSETLRAWIKQADLDSGQRTDGLDHRRTRGPQPLASGEPHLAYGTGGPGKSQRLLRSGDRADPGSGVPVRRARAGQLSGSRAVPRAGRLPQWLLRLAIPPTVGPCGGQRAADHHDPADPCRKPWLLRRTAGCMPSCGRRTVWAAAGSGWGGCCARRSSRAFAEASEVGGGPPDVSRVRRWLPSWCIGSSTPVRLISCGVRT